jgi:hypothetical protein
MGDLFRGAQRPVGLVFSAPLARSGECGERFDASHARITVRVADRVAWDVGLELPFRFEP